MKQIKFTLAIVALLIPSITRANNFDPRICERPTYQSISFCKRQNTPIKQNNTSSGSYMHPCEYIKVFSQGKCDYSTAHMQLFLDNQSYRNIVVGLWRVAVFNK